MSYMRFKDTNFCKSEHCKEVKLPFGNFYLSENFFVSEINEGVHLNEDMIQQIIFELLNHYGEDKKVANISNRIHSYSIDLKEWYDIINNTSFIFAFAIVTNNQLSYINATLEKIISKKSIKRCKTIEEAVNWVKNLREFT